jgi:hypothetical protein
VDEPDFWDWFRLSVNVYYPYFRPWQVNVDADVYGSHGQRFENTLPTSAPATIPASIPIT